MNNKRNFFLIGMSLLINLLLPIDASSMEVHNYTHFKPRLYISGQYRPGVSHFSKFSVKETHCNTVQLVGLTKDIKVTNNSSINTNTSFNFPYVAEFQDNAMSFSGAIGCFYSENFRIEVEASYEEFDVKNPEGSTTDSYRYFALARGMDGNNIPTSQKFTVMRNDGLLISSVMINGCYNVILNDIQAEPYICAGLGGDFIEFFNGFHVKLAYQGKVGISYQIFPEVRLFIDGYYHKVKGNKFKNLHVQHVGALAALPKVTSAVATLNIGYFGCEAGVRFIF
ncbi:P44/Msp2 family outer membrane protein [Ehrlichia canis]|uniref:Surface antigen msp4 n=2 Tax=Ehrlichia canis TaxID=944 RepID=A0ACA6AWX4_EHRCJ|nr:P44/Msp2 family outer membrane protein [Ehrlichia canis]AAK28691.1 major outer membrane protein P30-9 [Ehrlichia canis]AAZ68937.1 Surface antigen msp4 [Ehrlichia canis str. Jake]